MNPRAKRRGTRGTTSTNVEAVHMKLMLLIKCTNTLDASHVQGYLTHTLSLSEVASGLQGWKGEKMRKGTRERRPSYRPGREREGVLK